MLIFIDDSGGPGFKVNKGSSAVFVLALIIFDDHLEAEKAAVELKLLRRQLKFPDIVEFKFHKSSPAIKEAFLQRCATLNFRVRAIVVRKSAIQSNKLRTSKESFFNYFVMCVLKNNNMTIKNAKIRVDQREEKRLRNELRVYLSRELDNKNNHIFTDLSFVDSKKNILIQLADMVAGTIGAYYKGSNTSLKKIIQKRIEDIWEFK